VAEAAAQFGFALCLAGHTHGGQICLPNGKALVLPTKNLPPALVAGRWQAGPMPGYTSRGTGSCGVNARFHCPPEITLHTLYSPPR
jgi:predicted MPP superfamily phosphohydrolase